MLGTAAKIEVTKENCTIVGDGSSEEAVKSRVKQIKNIVANTDQDYEKEKLNERIARLSGGVAIIQVSSSGAPLMLPCLHPLCICTTAMWQQCMIGRAVCCPALDLQCSASCSTPSW